MIQRPESGVLALVANLRKAAEAVASTPMGQSSALVDRIAALGAAAAAVQALLSGQGALGGRERRLVRDEARMAQAALARCRRTRGTLRDLVAMATGRHDEYGRDGTVAVAVPQGGPVRHV